MKYIEPHGHMVSRTTDDYEKLALAGCEAICEPAFWAGFDRSSPAGFYDYYRQLTDYEPKRAAKYGIPHFCWLCINPKEAEDAGFAREVMAIIPEFLDKPTVLGIGEIGLNKNSRSELAIFEEHVQLALDRDLPILIHTPHLEDKRKGTRLILDSLASFSKLNRDSVIIDHVEEHTVGMVLDGGYWAGMTLYPESKCSPNRAIDMLEMYHMERLWLNSACDWGVSDPLAVVKCGLEMKKRKYSAEAIERVLYDNPKKFLSQSPRFVI
ncbi:TatD family hydrolase [Luteolibacter ambystomatis]|uniref:TatD family hydrolase n=1 Tax=Luteolibacter ambystomatis TaxID=2824561 RepID=A0A975IZR1_9BACT|nr:TatD family hydrolase [Luteolibacter ambystomatis]QUE51509.1 TatD family hydrolase [Luteolibacter ambystomatis]